MTTIEDVVRTIARHVAEELKAVMPRQQQRRLLTSKEAASYLRISEAQLSRLKAESRVRFIQERKNARIYYDIVDLDRYIDEQKD
jgi:hypothetical protein